jgi:hypothetical protein
MKNEYIRLLKNIFVLGFLVFLVVLVVNYFMPAGDTELTIDSTPIHIESIKTIAEISTVSYKDEVVIDTVEYYGEFTSVLDPDEWMRVLNRGIKRRLTLIIQGEVKYGIDLTNKNYSVVSNKDSIWVTLPQPKILDVIISPSKTEVFQEQGSWSDNTRRKLEVKAKFMIQKNAEAISLQKKAKENTIRLFKKLIRTPRTLIIKFEDAK